MNNFNNREVLRAIMKGDITSLREYFFNGLTADSKTEQEGWSLLHQATVIAGRPANVESIKYLLENGVSPNHKDIYGNLALHYSVRNNDIDTVRLLVDFNSEINVLNQDGISPLHQALLNSSVDIEVVGLLLSYGASIQLGTVKEFATVINHSAVNEVFSQYGS